ncbi:hypothetical protein PAGA_b0110 [Pseudoalteromonas agarivorans DSM 14585]|uniref:Uncharacterized protein n=1 Tax=Pseudoalteromonas agarivorans DSM 14585 TaxID=1312369 RepID=A0ACA8E193_9GAMM|nr:hypothetical protein PAGA_b0110 [Pseudoalteromonas agarivorans DSM 14585]
MLHWHSLRPIISQIRVLIFSFHHLLKSVFKRFAVTVNAERLLV